MSEQAAGMSVSRHADADSHVDLRILVRVALSNWLLLGAIAVVSGVVVYLLAGLLPPKYTARMTLLPPQQQQSAAASALASFGSLAALVGGNVMRTSTDQYVALMRSVTVSDKVIAQFGLMDVYSVTLHHDAREQLAGRVRIAVGRRDGMITVEVDDRDPQRSADMANAYAVQLREIVGALAISEAQQRRQFYEEQFLKLKQSIAGPPGEVFSDAQADARMESARSYARQYEAARLDETGKSTVVQVVDPATPPEKRSGPRKARMALGGVVGGGMLTFGWLVWRRMRTLRPVPGPALR